ncbi:hypothetical protein [Pseudomonas deceptionensis]|uniref:Uncharacterized protein n=1 Tax=Pseudomonas deceptionensis TaxID=882211 RepID=A0A0J6G869_PSEDM|nr:hypothetical protein [Pseudomonas deceptionensis]KMM77815.1 hypothetical protein TR67_21775 [Pseudomonas deceptionensis]SEE21121.1 hypothetical protein SAMN04489800_0216 [Pseudomonas deceptionensis]
MFNKPKLAIKTGLAIATLMAASSSFAEVSKNFTASCSASNFTGTAYLTAVRGNGQIFVRMTGYKISAPSSSKSRSKANANLQVWGSTGLTWTKWAKSGDNLKQDGSVHSVYLSEQVRETRLGAAQVQFIFDSSGNDPKCIGKVMIPGF